MNKETIKCPFCFKESEFGVRVCTGCHSKISYGEVSAWVSLLIGSNFKFNMHKADEV
ncbi:hypothetical protein [Enterobacter cancerogenus]|uniref:hypothetical protein n=1 Tax=Enterobacter cancerogenus TaxID=69218 RepID=UPI0028B8C8E7|nr:hypothetical protein [Enterobacter cancerogenus]MDT7009230.1 hypothetical protein [Enterobacter cancerogenus]WNN59048.1 hypothetical protein RIN64_04755 [Enterobacter cancerogenus]